MELKAYLVYTASSRTSQGDFQKRTTAGKCGEDWNWDQKWVRVHSMGPWTRNLMC